MVVWKVRRGSAKASEVYRCIVLKWRCDKDAEAKEIEAYVRSRGMCAENSFKCKVQCACASAKFQVPSTSYSEKLIRHDVLVKFRFPLLFFIYIAKKKQNLNPTDCCFFHFPLEGSPLQVPLFYYICILWI